LEGEQWFMCVTSPPYVLCVSDSGEQDKVLLRPLFVSPIRRIGLETLIPPSPGETPNNQTKRQLER